MLRFNAGVPRTQRVVAAAFAGALLLAACGDGSESASESASSADPAAAVAFTAPSLSGAEIDGAAYADQATLFWFWAPW